MKRNVLASSTITCYNRASSWSWRGFSRQVCNEKRCTMDVLLNRKYWTILLSQYLYTLGIQQLNARFLKHETNLSNFSYLFPIGDHKSIKTEIFWNYVNFIQNATELSLKLSIQLWYTPHFVMPIKIFQFLKTVSRHRISAMRHHLVV